MRKFDLACSSIFLFLLRRLIGVLRAEHWRGPYLRVTTDSLLFQTDFDFAGIGKKYGISVHSPFVYIDKTGHFHMLFVLSSTSSTSWAYGQHAYSTNGVEWTWNVKQPASVADELSAMDHEQLEMDAAFHLAAKFDDGSTQYFSRRERPFVFLDRLGEPSLFVTGVLPASTAQSWQLRNVASEAGDVQEASRTSYSATVRSQMAYTLIQEIARPQI